MYNKLFTKILDSSIWLESHSTRIVWITLIAAMDEDGYAHFSAIENLAIRSRVTIQECAEAVRVLSSPDKNSADGENEGRRIERVPGGFMILNAVKYREMATRVNNRESNRLRVQRHRDKKACNGPVMECNASEAYADTNTEEKKEQTPSLFPLKEELGKEKEKSIAKEKEIPDELDSEEFRERWEAFKQDRRERRKPMTGEAQRLALVKMKPWGIEKAIEALNNSMEKGWAGVFEPKGNPVRTLGTGSGSSVERSLDDYYGPVTKRDPNKKLTTPEERKAIFEQVRRGVEARP